MNNRKL
jgi:hypothetical protein